MISLNLDNSERLRPARMPAARKILVAALLGMTAVALATPPLGFILNQILAKGVISSNISENVQITKSTDSPWGAEVQTHGATDFYVQHLVLAPGGYSGWHVHPGILIGTLTAGSIDFYNEKCQKRTVGPGEVYFETGTTHGIYNAGSVDADLYISYLIKHGAPRRMESDAPACAVTTPIP